MYFIFVVFVLVCREFNPKYLTKLPFSFEFFNSHLSAFDYSILYISHTFCLRKHKREKKWRLRSKWRNFYQATIATLQTVLLRREASAYDNDENDKDDKNDASRPDDEKVPEVRSRLKLDGTLTASSLKLTRRWY